MTAEHGPEQGRQRTVAELLEQYGDGRSGAPRRRRRADDEPPTPDGDAPAGYPGLDAPAGYPGLDAPAALPDYGTGTHQTGSYEPSGYEPGGHQPSSYQPSGYEPGSYEPGSYGPSSYEPSGHQPSSYEPSSYEPSGYEPSGYEPSGHQPSSYEPSSYEPSSYEPSGHQPSSYEHGGYEPSSYEPSGYEPSSYQPGGYGSGGESLADAPSSGAGLLPEQRWASQPGIGQSIHPLTGEPIEPTTELLPRFASGGGRATDLDAGPMTGPMTGSLTSPITGPLTGVDADTDDGPPTGRVSSEELFADAGADGEGDPARAATSAGSVAPAGLADRDESGALAGPGEVDEDEPRRLGVLGWIGLVLQLLLGVVAGAALWVGFSYLWRHYPFVALSAVAPAIFGLVLVVRALRRQDDVQTIMLAMFVGLVVTVSPVVLLLTVG